MERDIYQQIGEATKSLYEALNSIADSARIIRESAAKMMAATVKYRNQERGSVK